jgi:hypothetical protein
VRKTPTGKATPPLGNTGRDPRRSRYPAAARNSLPPLPLPPATPQGTLDLPKHAPEWMVKGRALAMSIETAIAAGRTSRKVEAAIDRAYGAFHLDSISDVNIARVAHLVRRAHDAIRSAKNALDSAHHDCARVLHLGLPSALRRRLALDDVVEVVRRLRREADSWLAVVDGTMVLLGWSDNLRGRAAHAIRLALDEYPADAHDQG